VAQLLVGVAQVFQHFSLFNVAVSCVSLSLFSFLSEGITPLFLSPGNLLPSPSFESLPLYLCKNSLGRFSYLFALFISWRCFRFWQRQTLLPLFAFVTKINALALICRLQIATGHTVFPSASCNCTNSSEM